MKKAKQRAALQKHPTPLKKSGSASSGSGKPPAKKIKLIPPKKEVGELGGGGTLTGSSLLLTGSPDLKETSSPITAALPVIQTVNLSSKLTPGSTKSSELSSGGATNDAQPPLPPPPKEPPTIPDKLPAAVLVKVTNLEQVSEIGWRLFAFDLEVSLQLILKEQEVSGKITNKVRTSYDEHLIE